MTTVQLAISDSEFAYFPQELLLSDRKHNVLLVDRPDLKVPGLIVVEVGLSGELSNLSTPARFVVVAQRADDLMQLWRVGIRTVVFNHHPAKTAYFAILAAELRLRADMGHKETGALPTQGEGHPGLPTLSGPFVLSDRDIDREVIIKSPGAYLLDDSDDVFSFHVTYVGRSDIDVNNQLHVHVGAYRRFKYEYCLSPRAACVLIP